MSNDMTSVAVRNLTSFIRSATFRNELDRETALNCVQTLRDAIAQSADTLTRPADGEFHECPHCKGWSRTSAQQPAEAVAVDPVEVEAVAVFHADEDGGHIGWLLEGGSAEMCDGDVLCVLSQPRLVENDGHVTLHKSPPPAIDIGKLRELVARWRADASGGEGYTYTKYEEGRIAEKRARASELAALIGDGGEKGNG